MIVTRVQEVCKQLPVGGCQQRTSSLSKVCILPLRRPSNECACCFLNEQGSFLATNKRLT